MKKDVLIIGGGPSGLLCAIEAGKRGRSVIVLDHAARIGNKIRVSGGGRCNFSNLSVASDNYLSGNPHFCKSALARFGPREFLSLIEKHHISYIEKEGGRLFCRKSSSEIVSMLHRECEAAGVQLITGCEIEGLRKEGDFMLATSQGPFRAGALVVATGGVSYPELGASGLGYRIARQFGIGVAKDRPALVPLLFGAEDRRSFGPLSGVSFRGEAACGKRRFRGDVLFTHTGLSGPAILQCSLYRQKNEPIKIDLIPDTDIGEMLLERRQSRMELHTLLAGLLPERLARAWCGRYAPSRPVCRYSDRELKDIGRLLHGWEITPSGTAGYAKAEVTAGGIETDELSSKTMESKKVRGLYFIGEVVDVTGQLGGYNLQWAWSSGFAAGQYV